MTSLYLDALELDRTGEFSTLRDWLHATMPGRFGVNYLSDVQIWQFDFPDAQDAILFKLAWGGK